MLHSISFYVNKELAVKPDHNQIKIHLEKLALLLEQVKEKRIASEIRLTLPQFEEASSKDDFRMALKTTQSIFLQALEKDWDVTPDEWEEARGKMMIEFAAIERNAFPLKPPRWQTLTDVTVCERKVDYVEGGLDDAERIVRGAIDSTNAFLAAIVTKQFEAAYTMIAPFTRQWMTVKRMQSDHKRGFRSFAGAEWPSAFEVQSVRRIYTEAVSQRSGNTVGEWPSKMPREAKRATIQAWIETASSPDKRGCWCFLWIAEEALNVFSIAKFQYYTM